MVFYTDRTGTPVPRTRNFVTPAAWQGLAALIRQRIDDGSLAIDFPARSCPQFPRAITHTDEAAFEQMLCSLVPQLRWYYGDKQPTGGWLRLDKPPSIALALDIVDFVAQHIATSDPSSSIHHRERQHDHINFGRFDSGRSKGQLRFRRDVELIFARNGVAFTIGGDMRVHRLGPPELRRVLSDFVSNTGDPELDAKLEDAFARFTSRDMKDRADALEKIWDAFERLKTLEIPTDKRKSIERLVERAAPDSALREHLLEECRKLTDIGNQFQIRHFEHDTERVPDSAVDYLFTRMAALISHLLRETGRG